MRYSFWTLFFVGWIGSGFAGRLWAQSNSAEFNVLAFYTAKNDQAHISFVQEANRWFARMGTKHHFRYEATDQWDSLRTDVLSQFQVVVFLDTRPEDPTQRKAFQQYMEQGGAWLGFHFSAFSLTPSDFPQDWDWYHQEFLGSGEYSSNTWRPTSAILKVEDSTHLVTQHLPNTFQSSPNEWYRWQNDLQENPDIRILLSIDPSSFPLGTGPKPHEIWHSGYYPVVWMNTRYRMIYMNMGHNDIDYEHNTNEELSFTFQNETQNTLIMDAIRWLGSTEAER
ncbi:MAG: ThuA domain-containing protein [Cyclobacteriaceae bacterium]|jgi:hypothetical protein